jgi:hypothetical protein
VVKRISASMALVLVLSVSACGSTESPTDEKVNTGSTPETERPTEAAPTATEEVPGAALCAEKSTGQECTFGQIATFTARRPSTAIEITVAAPEAFTPNVGPEVEGATQAENVYFQVTLTNLSNTEVWHPLVLPSAVSGGKDGSAIYTNGRCCGGEEEGMLIPDEVAPGETVTFRDEWSVADADDITYELDIDGLAGHLITFSP